MTPPILHRLPAPLEAAVQSVKLTARHAVERSIESLGLAALAALNAFARDGLLGAQFELNRKSAVFALRFNDALDERIARELAPKGSPAASAPAGAGPGGFGGFAPTAYGAPAAAPPPTSWESFSLVDDRTIDDKISAERLALEIGHGCEWELRELDAFVRAVLPQPAAAPAIGGLDIAEPDAASLPNPLRPEVVAHALYSAINTVSDRPDIVKTLAGELGRSFAALLPATYAGIVGDMRHGGVQPRGLTVRPRGARGGPGAGPGGAGGPREEPRHPDEVPTSGYGSAGPGFDSRHGSVASRSGWPGSRGGTGPTSGHGAYAGPGYAGAGAGGRLGAVAPGLMHVIRRIAHHDSAGFGSLAAPAAGFADTAAGHDPAASWIGGGPLPNLIHVHRDELRQASSGPLDHLVIDVIASLFDAILADPKVPPQMARQIARLQLPVLRAALGDPAFFSSRKHPVRRFVNRIASLGAAFEDFADERAKQLLSKVRSLVQQVVEGDFEQMALYEQQLSDLEAFVAEQNRAALHAEAQAADELLAAKENEARLAQVYAARLQGELRELAAPDFVRDFLATTWGQVLVIARTRPDGGGDNGPLAQRLRAAGRELFMSVMPKASPAHRKQFLAELPKLMATLTEGLDLIAWPEANRRDFFGRLMPAHAEALKAAAARQLDLNLAARQVEMLLEKPLPSGEEVKAAAAVLPVLTEEVPASAFTPAEAERVGLLKESAVDWSAPVPAPPIADIPIEIPAAAGALATTAAAEPAAVPLLETPIVTAGRALADEVQVGYPYQMLIDAAWTRVKLVHVSPGRSFFAFQHGTRHKKTISLTQRMLVKLCESGRLRAFESAELMDRASARARQQLAQLAAARG
jgi:hypothetical protein